MKFGRNYLIRVIACQAVIFIVISTILFWGRGLCQMMLWKAEWSQERWGRWGDFLKIEPSGLSDGMAGSPGEVNPSRADVRIEPLAFSGNLTGFYQEIRQLKDPDTEGIGVWHSDLNAPLPNGDRRINLYETASYQAESGRLIYRQVEINEENHERVNRIIDYAGPAGVNADANADLGRFQSPVIGKSGNKKSVIVYDRGTRRFYEINFERREVRRGNELPKDHPEPVQIDSFWGYNIQKNSEGFRCGWTPENLKKKSEDHGSLIQSTHMITPVSDFLVLDDQCRIEYLDRQSLELIGSAGKLVFYQTSSAPHLFKPDDALAYHINFCFYQNKFFGLVIGTLSRDGRAAALAVFDKNGKMVKSTQTLRNPAEDPAGPLLLVGKFILESLHPPILTLASLGSAGRGDAAAGYQAMFVLPYSFAGLIGYYDQDLSIDSRIPQIVGICGPAMALGLFLAWRVKRDARLIGLAPRTRQAWYWATFALGLSAYITYRLTRPKDVLVTCENCGRLRRPDRDRCHQCGAVWNVPELSPPDWRVVQPLEKSISISSETAQ